jgi:hypothetical protein
MRSGSSAHESNRTAATGMWMDSSAGSGYETNKESGVSNRTGENRMGSRRNQPSTRQAAQRLVNLTGVEQVRIILERKRNERTEADEARRSSEAEE